MTFKTPEYVAYQEAIYFDMKGVEWPFEDGQVAFSIEAGLSNRGADLDNVIKPLLDTYQGIFKGQFNDNKVYQIDLFKFIVKRGEEFIRVKVEPFQDKETAQRDLFEIKEES